MKVYAVICRRWKHGCGQQGDTMTLGIFETEEAATQESDRLNNIERKRYEASGVMGQMMWAFMQYDVEVRDVLTEPRKDWRSES